MSKRLVMCCDGTLNTPDEIDEGVPTQANVTKLTLGVTATETVTWRQVGGA